MLFFRVYLQFKKPDWLSVKYFININSYFIQLIILHRLSFTKTL